MSYDKLARFDARKTIGAAKDAVKGYAGNVSGGRYRKLQQQASALEGEMGQLLNVPKMNPKRGAKIKELRDAIAGMNPEIVAAKKARNYTRAGIGGALGLAGGGIAMSKTEKKANYIGGEPAGGYQMSRPITDLLKEAAFGKAVARGAKTYWGNLSGKAYRAARTASESAASIYGKPDTRLVNTMAQAKKVRNLTRAGTGVGMGVAVAGGIGLKNNLKTAGQIGPYGNEEQSQQALSDVYRGMGRGALIGAGKGAIGGGAFGTLAGGMMTKGTGRGFARGAMAGAVVGALSHAAYGAYKGGTDAERARHGVKTAGAKELFRKGRQFGGTVLNDLTGKTYRRAMGSLDKVNGELRLNALYGGSTQRFKSLYDRAQRLSRISNKARNHMVGSRVAAGSALAAGGIAAGVSQARKARAAEPDA